MPSSRGAETNEIGTSLAVHSLGCKQQVVLSTLSQIQYLLPLSLPCSRTQTNYMLTLYLLTLYLL